MGSVYSQFRVYSRRKDSESDTRKKKESQNLLYEIVDKIIELQLTIKDLQLIETQLINF